jgi:formate/nitrite transporter FocA (FNT family)
MIPSMEAAKIGIIVMITYLMALGDFTHIVVGSAEVSYLVFAGELPWKDFWLVFAGPTLGGNIIGGSFIFALISHAQIRSEGDTPDKKDSKKPLNKGQRDGTPPKAEAERKGA